MQQTEGGPLAIGIDIGGTRTKIGLVDVQAGRVLDSRIMPTETGSAARFEETLGEVIQSLKGIARGQGKVLTGVGIGVSSFVFADGRVDSTYGFMPFLDDYPLAERISQAHGLPCRVDNDARLVALGEALYGAGRGRAGVPVNRVLVLTLGTGLGVGLVIGGMLDGPLPYAHMAGHITITQSDIRCYCGKTGCLESLVSATGFVAAAQRRGWKQHRSESESFTTEAGLAPAIFRAADMGDTIALACVTELVAHLKTGLSNYANLFAPDRIVLGGGLAKGLISYLSALKPPEQAGPYRGYTVNLAFSELNEEAGMLGSAALFR